MDNRTRIKIAKYHKLLQKQQEKGQPQEYAIVIDDFTVIPRTDEVGEFWDFVDYLDEDSYQITVKLFNGTSRNCDQFRFELGSTKQADPQTDTALGGAKLDVEYEALKDEIYELRIANNKLTVERDALTQERDTLKKQLEEVEDEADQLYEALEEAKAKKTPGFLQDLTPDSLGMLAGVIGQVFNKTPAAPLHGAPQTHESPLPPGIAEAFASLDDEQAAMLCDVVLYLAEYPEHIGYVYGLLAEYEQQRNAPPKPKKFRRKGEPPPESEGQQAYPPGTNQPHVSPQTIEDYDNGNV